MQGTILVLDDEPAACARISDVLEDAGYICESFSDSLLALESIVSGASRPDLIFSDIGMPGMDGLKFLKSTRETPSAAPLVLVSGQYEKQLAMYALRLGAADYLAKPFLPADVLALAERHCLAGQSQRTAIDAALRSYLRFSGRRRTATLEGLLEVLGGMGLKRVETLQHAIRVSRVALLIGERLGLSEQLDTLRIGATLHDIGKILIPYNIVMKPGPLDEREWIIMKQHAQIGWELLKPFKELAAAGEIVHAHHERFDGGGYPQGLAGAAIPLGSRIFAVADTLDAILSDRSYRQGRPLAEARGIVCANSGTQFDPDVVSAFQQVPDQDLIHIQDEARDLPPVR
jgi:putative nucleotidyltransferase with HDIG domain